MTQGDAYLRRKAAVKRRRQSQPAPEPEPAKQAPLIAQGARSRRPPPFPRPSVDDAIRAARRGGGLWRPLI
jgi:hypothetical protein